MLCFRQRHLLTDRVLLTSLILRSTASIASRKANASHSIPTPMYPCPALQDHSRNVSILENFLIRWKLCTLTVFRLSAGMASIDTSPFATSPEVSFSSKGNTVLQSKMLMADDSSVCMIDSSDRNDGWPWLHGPKGLVTQNLLKASPSSERATILSLTKRHVSRTGITSSFQQESPFQMLPFSLPLIDSTFSGPRVNRNHTHSTLTWTPGQP